jgi:hypothetical protein
MECVTYMHLIVKYPAAKPLFFPNPEGPRKSIQLVGIMLIDQLKVVWGIELEDLEAPYTSSSSRP